MTFARPIENIYMYLKNSRACLKIAVLQLISMHSGSCVYDNIQLLLYLQLYFVQFHVLILLPSALSMGLIFF